MLHAIEDHRFYFFQFIFNKYRIPIHHALVKQHFRPELFNFKFPLDFYHGQLDPISSGSLYRGVDGVSFLQNHEQWNWWVDICQPAFSSHQCLYIPVFFGSKSWSLSSMYFWYWGIAFIIVNDLFRFCSWNAKVLRQSECAPARILFRSSRFWLCNAFPLFTSFFSSTANLIAVAVWSSLPERKASHMFSSELMAATMRNSIWE